MYDGFCYHQNSGVGIKLGRYLKTNIKYKKIGHCCDRKYLKFNERLGFEIKDR